MTFYFKIPLKIQGMSSLGPRFLTIQQWSYQLDVIQTIIRSFHCQFDINNERSIQSQTNQTPGFTSMTIPSNNLFFLSTTSFCFGVLETDSSLLIPCYSQNRLNSLELNSPPLFFLKHLIFESLSFSIVSFKFLKHSSASNLNILKNTHIILV